jgi:hypothetical protein
LESQIEGVNLPHSVDNGGEEPDVGTWNLGGARMTGLVLGGGRGGATTTTGAEGSQVKVSTLLVDVDLSNDVSALCVDIDLFNVVTDSV